MRTDKDARGQLEYILATVDGGPEAFDIDGIAHELHDVYGTWDMCAIPSDDFWHVVAAHAHDSWTYWNHY